MSGGTNNNGGKRTNFPMELLFNKIPAGPNAKRASQCDGDYTHEEGQFFINTDKKPGQEALKTTNMLTLNPEVSLYKMGFTQDKSIDWSVIDMPVKTELHKLLHHRITSYMNPDLLIKIDNYEFRCHFLVLQCYTSYFTEKPVSRIEIPKNCVTKNAFTCIYNWMLSDRENSHQILARDNIVEIFMGAQFLGIKELEEQCLAFIDNTDMFSEDTAFMLYVDARKHGNTKIMELMIPRIQKFFLTLVSSKDFLDMQVEEVCVFLSSNYVCVHGEMEIFMSAVRWLIHDWEARSKHTVELMSFVKFGLILPWQLIDIQRNPESHEFLLITKIPEVSQMIEDGLAYAIIKYWYGNDYMEFKRFADSLNLKEPVGRNWCTSSKTYSSYNEFLDELAVYRKSYNKEKKYLKNESLSRSESNDSLSDAKV